MHQFFLQAWSAATSRNRLWPKNIEFSERVSFKYAIYKKVEEIINSYENMGTISFKQHSDNINAIREMKSKSGIQLTIGHSQKIINVMCKFCWCAGIITEPPHLTIDRKIIKKLPSEYRNINWTEMTEEQYYTLVKAAEAKAKKENNNSAVQWELFNWRDSIQEQEDRK